MTDRTKKPMIRDVSTMKPAGAKRKRPVVVVTKSALKRKHYARADR